MADFELIVKSNAPFRIIFYRRILLCQLAEINAGRACEYKGNCKKLFGRLNPVYLRANGINIESLLKGRNEGDVKREAESVKNL